jgi:hypothetical protein
MGELTVDDAAVSADEGILLTPGEHRVRLILRTPGEARAGRLMSALREA